MKSPTVVKLARRLPSENFELRAPASEEALAALPQLHAQHHSFLATTNGWGSFEGYEVLDVERVKKWATRLRDEGRPPEWVPFSVDSRANVRCVHSIDGRLIVVDRQDGPSVTELRDTLNDWLEDLDARLDAGLLALDDEGFLREVFATTLPDVAAESIEAIEAAMDDGDFEALAKLLAPTGVNATFYGDTTLMEVAIGRGAQQTVEWLLANGADVDCGKRQRLRAPLFVACLGRRPELELVKLFLSKGADPNAWSGEGTPLHAAAKWGHTEIVALLLSKGANPKVRDGDGALPVDLTESDDVRALLTA